MKTQKSVMPKVPLGPVLPVGETIPIGEPGSRGSKCGHSLPLAMRISNWSSWEKRLQLEPVLAASPNGDFDSHLCHLPPIGGVV